LLLARQGLRVVLLEQHADFDREFRGDTIHPATMELMDQLGLAERLLQLPHSELRRLTVSTETETLTLIDLAELNTRFPYITLMAQPLFLQFVTEEARQYPGFEPRMGADVHELVEAPDPAGRVGSLVQGVRYRARDGWHEVRALLTVGADGRYSRVRRLAGLQLEGSSPSMEVLWFRLPRHPDDPPEAGGRFTTGGRLLALLNRDDHWQIALPLFGTSYRELRAQGLPAFHRMVADLAPFLADRLEQIEDWKQLSLLSVASSYLKRWYRPGLLLIGDAAHVMTPVGGVGINYAVQDAVVAANLLSGPLRRGRLRLRDLAAVQRQRLIPTRLIQAFQVLLQKRITQAATDRDRPFRLPWFFRVPFLRSLPPRLMLMGLLRPRLRV
jgi:2-polyprenyl-6-methoxyphenol hydroxylase-like FAD-dependent oxidoreductase